MLDRMSSFIFIPLLFLSSLDTTAGDDCDDGWSGHEGNCYKQFPEKLNWQAAKDKCRGEGADLPTSKTKSVNDFLTAMRNKKDQLIWLNGKDDVEEGVWRWLDDGAIIDWVNWHTDEPQGGTPGYPDQDCLGMNGVWADLTCSTKYHFLCVKSDQSTETLSEEKKSRSGQGELFDCRGAEFFIYLINRAKYCLKHIDTKASFQDAVNECSRRDAVLFLPRNKDENNQLAILSGNKRTWMGVERSNKSFNWIDRCNTEICWNNWIGREGEDLSEMCASMEGNRHWYDNTCKDEKSFVCMKNPDGSKPTCPTHNCRQKPTTTSTTAIAVTTRTSENKVLMPTKAQCKNGGTCKVKIQPGSNDWFCLCQGKQEIGQAKDCSTGESDSKYPIPEKYMKLAVFIPVYAFAICCCLFCGYECFQNRNARNIVVASSASSCSISTDNVPRGDKGIIKSTRTLSKSSGKKCTYPNVTQKRKGQAVYNTQIEDTEDLRESTFENDIENTRVTNISDPMRKSSGKVAITMETTKSVFDLSKTDSIATQTLPSVSTSVDSEIENNTSKTDSIATQTLPSVLTSVDSEIENYTESTLKEAATRLRTLLQQHTQKQFS